MNVPRYHNRTERLKKLVDLKAPPNVVFTECLMVMQAVEMPEELGVTNETVDMQRVKQANASVMAKVAAFFAKQEGEE
jgi:hypothetical protein